MLHVSGCWYAAQAPLGLPVVPEVRALVVEGLRVWAPPVPESSMRIRSCWPSCPSWREGELASPRRGGASFYRGPFVPEFSFRTPALSHVGLCVNGLVGPRHCMVKAKRASSSSAAKVKPLLQHEAGVVPISPAPVAAVRSATEVRHVGRLFVDQVSMTQYVLSDIVTLESVSLPEGFEWDIVFDEESGMASLVKTAQEGGAEPVLCDPDDFLKLQLYQDEGTQELFTRQVLASGVAATTALEVERARFVAASLTLFVGANHSRLTFEVFVFRRARAGRSKVFWSFHSLYPALALTSYKSVPSKWVWRGMQRWASFLNSFGGVAGICQSTSCDHEAGPVSAKSEKCLPTTSLSTPSLVLMLARCTFTCKEQGGLDTKQSRAASLAIFEALLACVADMVVIMKVVFEDHWLCAWPRPHRTISSDVCVLRLDGGVLNLGSMVERAASGSRIPKKWVASMLTAAERRCPSLPLLEVFRKCIGFKSLFPFLAQLTWQVSVLIESALSGGRKQGGVAKAFEFTPNYDWMADERTMQAYLCRYVSATLEHSRSQQFYSIATDNGHLGGYPLQNTLITFPDNRAIIAPPAVPPQRSEIRGQWSPTGNSSRHRHFGGYDRPDPREKALGTQN